MSFLLLSLLGDLKQFFSIKKGDVVGLGKIKLKEVDSGGSVCRKFKAVIQSPW